jgi:hypothetical protein
VFVFSGASGQLLYRFDGKVKTDEMGLFLSQLPDINGDGHDEILTGAWGDDTMFEDSGAVYVFSGADGSTWLTYYGNDTNDALPRGLQWMTDADGDGVSDFYLGDHYTGATNLAFVYSGATGAQIGTIPSPDPTAYAFPGFGAGTGDVNGDGLGDLALGSEDFSPNGTALAGSTFVYIANALKAPKTVLIGTTLRMDLLAPKQAGKPFFVLLSLGDAGIPLGTRTIPLTPDALFFLSLRTPALRGMLDAMGRGQLELPIPNDPSISGIVIYGCFIAIDPKAPFGVPMISNGVAVTITSS